MKSPNADHWLSVIRAEITAAKLRCCRHGVPFANCKECRQDCAKTKETA